MCVCVRVCVLGKGGALALCGLALSGYKWAGQLVCLLACLLADLADLTLLACCVFAACAPAAEIHNIVGAGKSDGAMDASNLLKPMLARGELRCIGATTLDEYRLYIEKDPALERYACHTLYCRAFPRHH